MVTEQQMLEAIEAERPNWPVCKAAVLKHMDKTDSSLSEYAHVLLLSLPGQYAAVVIRHDEPEDVVSVRVRNAFRVLTNQTTYHAEQAHAH